MQALFRKLSRSHRTPRAVQALLRKLPYNHRDTQRSAIQAWRRGEAHCLEAAFIAAAILENHGLPPLVVSLESQDNLDHVLFVFRAATGWGAIGRSRDEALHGRPPRYRSVRDLVRSYVDGYVDKTGRITGFAVANLDSTGARWRDSPRQVWKTERYLIKLPHQPLPTSDARYRRELKRFLTAGPYPLRRGWW